MVSSLETRYTMQLCKLLQLIVLIFYTGNFDRVTPKEEALQGVCSRGRRLAPYRLCKLLMYPLRRMKRVEPNIIFISILAQLVLITYTFRATAAINSSVWSGSTTRVHSVLEP